MHPDDAYAQSTGLPRGKSEAWYILDAARDARIVLGLKRSLSASGLRASIDDGSIVDLVQWRRVGRDDVIAVTAGTIHAIGAGLVVLEVQQRSDVTYRLFDFGRQREVHVADAVAVAHSGPAAAQPLARNISEERVLLLATPHFVLERIELPADSTWELDASGEMWAFVLEGRARIGDVSARVGNVMFLEKVQARVHVGHLGLKLLATYSGPDPIPDLLRSLERAKARPALREISAEAAQ